MGIPITLGKGYENRRFALGNLGVYFLLRRIIITKVMTAHIMETKANKSLYETMATTPFRVSQGDGAPAPTTWINILSMCKTPVFMFLIIYFINVYASITYI